MFIPTERGEKRGIQHYKVERGDGRVLGGVIFRYEVLFVKNVFFFVTSTFFVAFFRIVFAFSKHGKKTDQNLHSTGKSG